MQSAVGRFYKAGLGLAAIILGLVAILAVAAPASADYIIFDKSDQHFHLTIWASPNPISEGNVHFTVRLARPDDLGLGQEYPVRHATLQLTLQQLDGVGADGAPVAYTVHKPQVADETDPGTYEIHDALYVAGDYTAHLKVEATEGVSQFDFPVKALPQPDDRLFDAILLGGIALLVFGIVLAYMQNSRKKDDPPSSSSQKPEVLASNSSAKV